MATLGLIHILALINKRFPIIRVFFRSLLISYIKTLITIKLSVSIFSSLMSLLMLIQDVLNFTQMNPASDNLTT